MTQTFATTNDTNDFYIDNNGNIAIVSGIEAVLQACATAAKAQLGEMIYAIDQGVPNFQTLWVGVPNIQQWEVALSTTLENVPGVVSVTQLNVIIANNELSYTATIQTTYGESTINGIF